MTDADLSAVLSWRGPVTDEELVAEARAAGCEWLFVDVEPHLASFYLDACGFRPTTAGLVHLPSLDPDR